MGFLLAQMRTLQSWIQASLYLALRALPTGRRGTYRKSRNLRFKKVVPDLDFLMMMKSISLSWSRYDQGLILVY